MRFHIHIYIYILIRRDDGDKDDDDDDDDIDEDDEGDDDFPRALLPLKGGLRVCNCRRKRALEAARPRKQVQT